MQYEVDTTAENIVAEQASLVGFLQCLFKAPERLIHKFAAHVVVSDRSAHRISRNGHAFNQRMRIQAQYVAILTSPGLTFIRIAHEVVLPFGITRHKAPLQTCRKASTTAAAQT